ncbi:MAG: potassium-transporting ATPase subunit KdpA [Bdellovibrionota bacterium]
MNEFTYLHLVFFFLAILAVTKPLGLYLASAIEGSLSERFALLGKAESALCKICGIDKTEDMSWSAYAKALLLFSAMGCALSYILLRVQGALPLNPQHYGVKEMSPDLAFNTAMSFTTNTNWQSYSPEATLSYFSNMVALAIHNWMSAAAGLAVAFAVIRGFARHSASGIGNFWLDVLRSTLYVFLPLCFLAAMLFVASGVPQNFLPYQTATTLEGEPQVIAQGPVASQEAIKQLGTNGGGFFNANSAHPYENPTPATNFLSLVMVFAIPAGLTYSLGKLVGNTRQGWAIFAAMSLMFLFGAGWCTYFEQRGTPHLQDVGLAVAASADQPGGNMEGKEVRFGIADSALFATVTTDASCGAVNAMHDSFTPLGGLVPLFNILTGEVIFGGVGAGLYGMLMFAVLTVFIAGLMVGRTPEYLGKKIQRFEVQMTMLSTLVLAASILGFTALAVQMSFSTTSWWNATGGAATGLGPTTANFNNVGSHGFSEALYAFASGTGNNGSAFAGLTANTPFYNFSLGVAMYIGRFLMIIPLLAMAGSLARKKRIELSSGTFPTDNATFSVLLIGVVVIVNALTFFPALSLGPIAEHFQLADRILQ